MPKHHLPVQVAPVPPVASITPSAPVASNDLLNKVTSKQVTDEDLLATFIGNNYPSQKSSVNGMPISE